MAMIETAHKAPFGAITSYRASSALWNLATTVQTWFTDRVDAYRTATALERLSPKMLDDIGLTQADVDTARARARLL